MLARNGDVPVLAIWELSNENTCAHCRSRVVNLPYGSPWLHVESFPRGNCASYMAQFPRGKLSTSRTSAYLPKPVSRRASPPLAGPRRHSAEIRWKGGISKQARFWIVPRVSQNVDLPQARFGTRRVSQTMPKHGLGKGIRVSRTVLSSQARFRTRAECPRPCQGMVWDKAIACPELFAPEARFWTNTLFIYKLICSSLSWIRVRTIQIRAWGWWISITGLSLGTVWDTRRVSQAWFGTRHGLGHNIFLLTPAFVDSTQGIPPSVWQAVH
ncbi:hypothetical protein Bbelb_388500 [Branchiostoma belcheri]|nr:hypothetical protein Bbelb_388500 [Branchiostoma belcheri]